MEKKTNTTEDDCVDSGAETGGSDYSRVSSTSSEYSLESVQDPFHVSMHIIADPGKADVLQNAIDNLLAWINPDLQLFRVSEGPASQKQKRPCSGVVNQPSIAVILFLQEEYGKEQILKLHKTFQRPPWQYHHTERVHGRILPYMPCNQDFFTLAQGTPLWAIRQVHYGKEIIRFTIYCSYRNFADMIKLYQLILKGEVSHKKLDFCVFHIFSNIDVEIQLSLKRLPKGQYPSPTEFAVLEFRVKGIGHLVPLLPYSCSPISEYRWQTEDYDGNKILLQVRSTSMSSARKGTLIQHNETRSPPFSPVTFIPKSDVCTSEKIIHQQKMFLTSRLPLVNGLNRCCGISQQDLSNSCHENVSRRSSGTSEDSWSIPRCSSLFCLPTTGCSPLPMSPFNKPFQLSSDRVSPGRILQQEQRTRLAVELEDAEETDVDTGMRVSFSDLSVVSAYSAPSECCSDMENALPVENQHKVSTDKAIHRVRPLSAMSNPLPSTSTCNYTSLRSLNDLTSDSFLSSQLHLCVLSPTPNFSKTSTVFHSSSQTAEIDNPVSNHETSEDQSDKNAEEFYI
ncbi:protein FAM124A [Protopterus annectens]|uniref:protein FAM124A n=1 Tax=Protopterus annectens TaxID=7888 RepID=UPI001CF9F075|nr:protein FAM124A [Protopterus annectens]